MLGVGGTSPGKCIGLEVDTGVFMLNDTLGLRRGCGTGRTKFVDSGVGDAMASDGASTPVARPLFRGNVFEVLSARFLRLRAFLAAGAVGENRRLSFESLLDNCFSVPTDGNGAGVSGEVPGVSAKFVIPGYDVPVMGEESVESVVVVEMLPRPPFARTNGSSLKTDLREPEVLLDCCVLCCCSCCCCPAALLPMPCASTCTSSM